MRRSKPRAGPSVTIPELGIIEGYYGTPWTWDERAGTLRFVAEFGYRFYMYAPKADPWLRRKWREDHPAAEVDKLENFSRLCSAEGVRFGVGLTPWGIHSSWDDEARTALARKLETLDTLRIQDLALLFDDMRGDAHGLAELQVEVSEFVRKRTGADRLFLCPTYYSDDPVLDLVFGNRPPDYLAHLGRALHSDIEVFWTGPEVVSRGISAGHMRRVAGELGRKPFLWDNYPVNDGQRMSKYLHLRGFTGRPASLGNVVAGHAVNPSLQPTLTRIPLATLPAAYREGDAYDYAEAFRRAARDVLGDELGARIREDLVQLQDVGRHGLGAEREKRLRDRYATEDHSGAREIIRWLDGEYSITDEAVRTQ